MAKDWQKKINFNYKDWVIPDGIGHPWNYAENKEGVYLILEWDFLTNESKVVYVGKSKNLNERLKNHPVTKLLLTDNKMTTFLFKYTLNSTIEEIGLIKLLNPKYNKQWR